MSETQLLPRDQWKLEVATRPDDGRLLLIVNIQTRGGYWLCWQKMLFSEFSEKITCLDDIERHFGLVAPHLGQGFDSDSSFSKQELQNGTPQTGQSQNGSSS